MAFIINSKVIATKQIPSPSQKINKKVPYEIPERYRNSFYLANAAFFDSTNWFLHRAFEVIFPTLTSKLKLLKANNSNNNDHEIVEDIVKVLDQCNSIIDVRFPIKRDNGKLEVIRGFRVHYGLATGYKTVLGGLRVHENITRDQMKGLSVLSAYRNFCMGINMAGAFGGIKIDPRNYSCNELEIIVKIYATELMKKGYCMSKNGEIDIFQPDINSSQQEMRWISQAAHNYTGHSILAAPEYETNNNVFNCHKNMSGFGAFISLDSFLNNEEMMKKIGLETGLKGKTFIIQGIGKVGSQLAELLVQFGAICVGVKDIDAYLYDPKGIDLRELFDYKAATSSIKSYGLAKEETNDNIYTESCDILIFAAQQKSLICYIADKVKAKVVLEAADGPITPSAHQILTCKNKLVIPDIYACSGASINSYLEYLWKRRSKEIGMGLNKSFYMDILEKLCSSKQKNISDSSSMACNSMPDSVILEESTEMILRGISNELNRLVNMYGLGTDLRTAAYIIGITNIFNAIFEQNRFI